MASTPSGEYSDFVRRVVPLDQAQQQQGSAAGGSTFDSLAARIAQSSGGGGLSLFSGPCLLLGAAALAAALPGRNAADDGFWRVGSGMIGELLGIGNALAVPLALGAVVLLLLAIAAAVQGGPLASNLQAAQLPVSGAGGAGVGLIWAAFLALAAINFLVLLLIIALYVLGAILVMGLLLGMLGGGS